MYIVVLLIHPRKGLNVFAARSHSRIIHFFMSKNLNIIYSKNTQTTPQIYCNAVSIEKFTQLPSEIYIFYYIIVLAIMNLCQIRWIDCPYFVCIHL